MTEVHRESLTSESSLASGLQFQVWTSSVEGIDVVTISNGSVAAELNVPSNAVEGVRSTLDAAVGPELFLAVVEHLPRFNGWFAMLGQLENLGKLAGFSSKDILLATKLAEVAYCAGFQACEDSRS